MAFGSKKQGNIPAAPPSKKLEPYDIHVMPSKFQQNLAVRSKSSTSKLLIIIAIVFFVLTMLGIGGYFLYMQMSQPGQNANQDNQNQAVNNNENINPENENLNMENVNENDNANMANENLNADTNINVNGNENLNANENVNANLNANENANINAPVEIINYSGSLDSDSDLLTDTEEDLYQTEKRKADTDEDGYNDSEELKNGYNPKAASGSTLETSGLVNKYSNPLFNYEVLYPTSWLARPEDQSLAVILFMTSTEEFFKLSVEENTDLLDLVNWYLRLSPGADLNLLEKITTKKGYDALISPDKLTYYILDPNSKDKVYVFSYNIGTLSQINFLSTFKMMVNSFKVSLPTQ